MNLLSREPLTDEQWAVLHEDDIFGLGGQQVSDAEREVVKAIAHAVSS